MIMKTKFWYRGVVAALAASGLLLTAACSDDGSGDPEQPTTSDKTIDWWDIQPSDGNLGVIWAELATEYNEANPDGVQVNLTPIQNGPYNGVLSTAMQAEDPPDLFQSWGGAELRGYVERGLVRDVTDDLADVIETISPAAIAPWTVDGRVYGLPFNVGMVGFWYNTELFDQAGITETPTTWAALLDTVDQLEAAGITPISLGLGDASPWPGHFWWTYLVLRIGGLEALSGALEAGALNDPAYVQAGEALQELASKDPFPSNFLGIGYEQEDGQAATMGRGEAAMELMGQWSVGGQQDWTGAEGDAAQEIVDTRAWFPFPAVEGGAGDPAAIFGGGDGMAFGANAPDETLDFVRLIFENYDRIAATPGNVPTVKGMTDQLGGDNQALVPLVEAMEAAPGSQLYLDRDWPAAVGQEINTTVAAVIAGDITPQEMVDAVNEVWAREG
jgi:raffinose/stachyose/melibiose transport system substrate-binding protein